MSDGESGGLPQSSGVKYPSAHPAIIAQRVLRLPQLFEHFDPTGRGWWFDVRRDHAMCGTRSVSDALVLQVKFWCSENVFVEKKGKEGAPPTLSPFVPGTEVLREAICVATEADRVDEVHDYLDGLRGQWDGVARVNDLAVALGFSLRGETAVVEAELLWLRKFLISAVARGLSPGCQADNALVLMGRQGLGKSSCLRLLFGDDWVHESGVDMSSKDGAAVLSRAWCVELAELASLRRAKDVEEVKHFLSIREDSFRPAYGRYLETRPRRAVFVGTTNENVPFADPTGNRRFWPVRIESALDRAWLAANRDAVWREAVAAYESGEPWHLDAPQAVQQATVTNEYTHSDEWDELLRVKLANEDTLTLHEVAADYLGIRDSDLDTSTQRRLAASLRRLGFQPRRTEKRRFWKRVETDTALLPLGDA